MRNLIAKQLLLAGVLAWCAAAAEPRPVDLLAHGVDQKSYWIAVVVNSTDAEYPGPRTIVQTRGSGGSESWDLLPRISARVVALANYGSSLVALLDDGNWLLVDDTSLVTGQPMPGRAMMLGGDATTLWGVAAVPGGIEGTKAIATRPSTTSASTAPASTGPTMQAADARLVLMRLEKRKWIAVAELPKPWDSATAVAAMAVSDQQPVLAIRSAKGGIQLWRYGRDGQWQAAGAIQPTFVPVDVKLLDTFKGLRLWAAPSDGPGALWALRDGNCSDAKPLLFDGEFPVAEKRVAAYAFERVRLVFSRSGKMFEQCYDPDGEKVGQATEISPGRLAGQQFQIRPLELVALALLLLVLFGAMRRGLGRKDDREGDDETDD